MHRAAPRLLALGALLACGGAGAPAHLAGMPSESSLAEPAVDQASLRPDVFGYGPGTTELAMRGCDTPVEYALGELDARFGLGRRQALLAIERAAAIWERAAGRPLFRYSPRSALTIDFVYDERQEMLLKMESGRRDPLEEVLARYERLEGERNQEMAAHERRVAAYEAEGARGVPETERARREAERRAIEAEGARLNAMLPRIMALAADINSRSRTLTARDMEHLRAGYTERSVQDGFVRAIDVDIFMFSSWEHLPLIVAHELGHVLGLSHVAAPGSIMTGGPQPGRPSEASAADIAELRRVCP